MVATAPTMVPPSHRAPIEPGQERAARTAADHFDHADHDTEPLTESDLREQVDHEGKAASLACAGGEESRRDDGLQRPGADTTGGRDDWIETALMWSPLGVRSKARRN